MTTGYHDKTGKEICLGDTVKWRTKGLSGRGIVMRMLDEQCRKELGDFVIKDTRENCKSRNRGRITPFYDDAVYTIVEGGR